MTLLYPDTLDIAFSDLTHGHDDAGADTTLRFDSGQGRYECASPTLGVATQS